MTTKQISVSEFKAHCAEEKPKSSGNEGFNFHTENGSTSERRNIIAQNQRKFSQCGSSQTLVGGHEAKIVEP